MQTYDELIDNIFSKKPRFVNINLNYIRNFSKKLGSPEKAFPCVHIAGTNGKGSVAWKVAKALELSSLKVGLFTSPHLFSYLERIQINGQMITEEAVVHHLSYLLPLFEQFYPSASFFEITTLLAFQYFKEAGVDIAVIEAGLGGLLDTTSIISPLVSVITSIGNDHKEILGPTLEHIALHKAGIIKPSVPVVLGPSAVFPVILEIAKNCKSPVTIAQAAPGFYDWENQNIAQETLQILRQTLPLSSQAIEQGILVRPPCRFETQGNIIFDVAHNPDGFLKLIEALNTYFPNKKWQCLLALSKEKELSASLAILSQKASHIYLVEASTPRAASKETMGEILSSQGYTHFTLSAIEDALDLALSQEDLVVVCGSFYLMQEVRSLLLGKVAAQ